MMSWNGIRGAALGVAVGALSMMGAAATASPIDYEGSYDATSVTTRGNDHTVWLPGLFANFNAYWQFEGGAGSFVVGAGNGTADLDGVIVSNDPLGYRMNLDISYTLRQPNVAGSQGTKDGGVDGSLSAAEKTALKSTWSFFDIDSAVLTGLDALAGLTLTLIPHPDPQVKDLPFQLGDSANDKNTGLGGSGWFKWQVATTNQYTGPTARSSGTPGANDHGDININLAPVPLPAAGWMLIAGLGGLAAMRRRKRAS